MSDEESATPRTPQIEVEVPCPYAGDEREGFYLEVPYNRSFVQALKRKVPHADRRWNPEAERWWVVSEYADPVSELVQEAFGGYQLIRPGQNDIYRDGSGSYEQQSLL